MAEDYKSTVFLPKTTFPMRAGLPVREPEILAHWRRIEVWRRQRNSAKGKPLYVLHDGPPYANGRLHIGHALNKILKDVISRSRQMMGYDSLYVPGWDCHGLPIEWKVEENFRAAGKDKDQVPVLEFRQECRDFANHWIGVQSEEFQRLGVTGDWENPYTTLTNAAEATITAEIHKFLLNGGLYRGDKPVLWSVVEKTALAEAEVEYQDITSPTVYVRFAVTEPSDAALAGASILIWTTTPWTIPANRALAIGEDFDYGTFRVDDVGADSTARAGERVVLATALADSVRAAAGITSWTCEAVIPGRQLAGTLAAHPLRGTNGADGFWDFQVPVLAGDFVTTEVGTGIVHQAPGHGQDDFELCRTHGITAPHMVDADGSYYPHVPLLRGRRVWTESGRPGDANPEVARLLTAAGGLFASGRLLHSYPHSWRSKAPLIVRNTPQWFISMEAGDLRQRALTAIDNTRWVPPQARNRMYAMIESRPDWCISRQRTWGVPIAIFVDKTDGQPLRDPDVCQRITSIFAKEGSDSWFSRDPQDFLGSSYQANDYEQVRDIVDVWFESGSTHAFVLEARGDLKWPADLYLEGSDQHRGWFHSSLLESCGTRGRAPYDAVLTHGFVLDEQGRKMSKSTGNIVTLPQAIGQYGADIIRLWVVGSDYTEDLRVGAEILKYQADLYRRLRNTLRYLLGALDGYQTSERIDKSEIPDLELWVLARLYELDKSIRRNLESYDFHSIFTSIHAFCTNDLSAFYFDVRKDSLYCDSASSPCRRAARTVMEILLDHLTRWLAPMLSFTAEEAWLCRPGATADDSVHLTLFPTIPTDWCNPDLLARWERVRAIRRVVTGALEQERVAKRLGSSLQADVRLFLPAADLPVLDGIDLAQLMIVSTLSLSSETPPTDAFRLDGTAGVAVVVRLATGQRCERCWQVLETVGTMDGHADVCPRCADVLRT